MMSVRDFDSLSITNMTTFYTSGCTVNRAASPRSPLRPASVGAGADDRRPGVAAIAAGTKLQRHRDFQKLRRLVPLDAPEGSHEVEGPFEFQECGCFAASDPRLHVG